MAGIYLHIPFCKRACTYCNFHFATSLHYKDAMVGALVKEAIAEKDYLQGETVQTIYFGGGTPSLLSIGEVQNILEAVQQQFHLAEEAEITLEANPDDITTDKLRAWKDVGINRLSIGVQSFFEEELRWMNRAHHASQAMQCIEMSQKEGFHNVSIDLIYGSPLLTDEQWQQNVEKAVSLGIPHLSCYALTVEEKTALYKKIRAHKTADVDPDKQARQFLLLMEWLRGWGYEHYEVSNFARPGWRSRHNSSYWKGEKYLGLGPSAHSYNGIERRWNIANNQLYIAGMDKGTVPREKEMLTATQMLNEYLMITLRTMEGLDLDKIEKCWSATERKRVENRLTKYAGSGLISLTTSHARLTDEGMLMADGIAADLFVL